MNILFDVRFLPNPYWEDDLRDKSGLEQDVSKHVIDSDAGKEFLERLIPLLSFLILENKKAGKEKVVIGIGCTGGRHRSVAIVERVNQELKGRFPAISKSHRDIQKDGS